MKILVISLAGVGDTLMITPLLHELKMNFPESKIDILVMWGSSKGILKGNPHVDEVIHFNMIKEGLFKTLLFCKRLSKKKYDVSINTYPQSKIEYRLVAKIINAKLRLSHKYDRWSFIEDILVNKVIEQDYNIQCAENNLNLLKLLDKKKKVKNHRYGIYFSKNEEEVADNFIRKNKLENKILIGFHVGSSSTKNLALRRWPAKNYAELTRKLLDSDERIRILLFGSKEEEKENLQISKVDPERIIIVKEEDIKNSATILKRCIFFLSVDTALMHIASAVRVKNQIAIETPTFNKTVYPYNSEFLLIKNPLLKKDLLEYYRYDGKPINAEEEEIKEIMKGVKPDEVFEKIKKILKKDYKTLS
jgi:ADP-heptose:LPS heptosyltransferase